MGRRGVRRGEEGVMSGGEGVRRGEEGCKERGGGIYLLSSEYSSLVTNHCSGCLGSKDGKKFY